MDHSAMTTAMKAAISDVLEQMFFLPVDFADTDGQGEISSKNPERVAVRIDFDGPFSGRFTIRLQRSLAESITADFLGVSSEALSGKNVTDTVKEMINMLSGSTLGHYDHASVFDLGIPEQITSIGAPSETAGRASTITLVVNTYESRIRYELSIR